MAWLTLNGHTIPVAEAQEITEELGERGRAFSGAALEAGPGIKRSWRCRTPPLKESDYRIVRDLVLGEGSLFRYSRDLYDGKGNGPSVSTGAQVVYPADQLVNDTVINHGPDYDGVSYSDEGDEPGGGWCEVASAAWTNLLAANQRDCEDGTSGFHAEQNATITHETAHYFQGAASIKVVCSDAGTRDGVRLSGVAAAAATVYWGSAWVRPTTTVALRIYLVDQTNAVTGTAVDVVCPRDVWTRIAATVTTGAGAVADLRMYIVETTITDDPTFYVDACQIVAVSDMPWADGAGVAGALTYPGAIVQSFTDLTISLNVAEHHQFSLARTILDIYETTTKNRIKLESTASNEIVLTVWNRYGNDYTFTSANGQFTGSAWKYIAVVVRRAPETGEHYVELFIDGAAVDNDTIANLQFARIASIDVGHSGGTSGAWRFKNLCLVPYAMSAAQIAALHTTQALQPGALPKLAMSGDLLAPETLIYVVGEVPEGEYVRAMLGNSFRNNARRVEFLLHEV